MAARPKKKPKPKSSDKSTGAQEEQTPDGVLVVVDDGGQLQAQPVGDVKPAEVPTILRVAAKGVEDAMIDAG